MNSWPIPELSAFYHARCIAVDQFQCPHQHECDQAAASISKELHHGAEAYVGEHYGSPFRIVVVSLSISDGTSRLEDRTSDADWLTNPGQPLNPHMKGTLEILRAILEPDISDRQVFRHFALTKSAKCSLKGSADKPPPECFKNCAEFVIPELSILSPQLVISQGREAANALQASASPLPSSLLEGVIHKSAATSHEMVKDVLRAIYKEHFFVLQASDFRALWLKLVHPADRGGRWRRMKRLGLVRFLGWAARNLVKDFFA